MPGRNLGFISRRRPDEDYRTALDMHRRSMKDGDFVQRVASGEPLASLLSGRAPLWAQAKVLYEDKSQTANS